MIKAEPLKTADLTGIESAICLRDGLVPDAEDAIQTYYGQLAIMPATGSNQIGFCVAKNRPYIVDKMEQHQESAEVLGAMNGSFIVPCAPSIEVDGKPAPDFDHMKAIKVEQGEAIMFDVGVWHWTPYAVTPECNVLVCFKKDTPANDFHGYEISNPVEMSC